LLLRFRLRNFRNVNASRARLPIVPLFLACWRSHETLIVPSLFNAPARLAAARKLPGFLMAF
jgi:hypothetical protein